MKPSPKFGTMSNYSIYVINGKMGLACGYDIITQPKYDIIYPFRDQYAIVQLGNKYGIIDKLGKEVIPTIYTILFHVDKNIYWYYRNGIYYYSDFNLGIFDRKTKMEEHTDSISNLLDVDRKQVCFEGMSFLDFEREKYIPFSIDDDIEQTGIFVPNKNKIIFFGCNIGRCCYDENIVFLKKNNKYGIANFNEEMITPYLYDDIVPPYLYDDVTLKECGLIAVRKNNKWGFIDIRGNVMIDFQFDLVGNFYNGKTWVTLNGKCGIIDTYGNIVVPIVHDSVNILKDNTFVLEEKDYGNHTVHYEVYGKPAVNLRESYENFYFDFCTNSDLVKVKKYGKYGIIRLNGEVVLEPRYDDIQFKSLGEQFIVKVAGKWGVINLKGRELLPMRYDKISLSNVHKDGYTISHYQVALNNKVGIFNEKMQEVFPIQYDYITYNETYQAYDVRLGKEYAMMDLEHNILVPFSNNRP